MTTTGTPSQFEFECPACHGTMAVEPHAQQALLEAGCVFCGRDLATTAFEPGQ